MRLVKGKVALSKVISVIIIVAIAIGLAVGVALWTTGVIETFLRVEKVQLTIYTDYGETPDTYKITIEIKNTGTRDSVIDGIYVNGQSFWKVDVSRVSFYIEDVNQTLVLGFLLPIGKAARIEVYLGPSFQHAQLVEVKLHTAAGSEIIAAKNLP